MPFGLLVFLASHCPFFFLSSLSTSYFRNIFSWAARYQHISWKAAVHDFNVDLSTVYHLPPTVCQIDLSAVPINVGALCVHDARARVCVCVHSFIKIHLTSTKQHAIFYCYTHFSALYLLRLQTNSKICRHGAKTTCCSFEHVLTRSDITIARLLLLLLFVREAYERQSRRKHNHTHRS